MNILWNAKKVLGPIAHRWRWIECWDFLASQRNEQTSVYRTTHPHSRTHCLNNISFMIRGWIQFRKLGTALQAHSTWPDAFPYPGHRYNKLLLQIAHAHSEPCIGSQFCTLKYTCSEQSWVIICGTCMFMDLVFHTISEPSDGQIGDLLHCCIPKYTMSLHISSLCWWHRPIQSYLIWMMLLPSSENRRR